MRRYYSTVFTGIDDYIAVRAASKAGAALRRSKAEFLIGSPLSFSIQPRLYLTSDRFTGSILPVLHFLIIVI